MNIFFALASLVAFFSVALGAFGAHMVKPHISVAAMATYQTGIKYMMFNTIALFVCSFGLHLCPDEKRFIKAFYLFIFGTVIFSGSLLLIAGTGQRSLGVLTPVGGLIQLSGWVLLAMIGFKKRETIG